MPFPRFPLRFPLRFPPAAARARGMRNSRAARGAAELYDTHKGMGCTIAKLDATSDKWLFLRTYVKGVQARKGFSPAHEVKMMDMQRAASEAIEIAVALPIESWYTTAREMANQAGGVVVFERQEGLHRAAPDTRRASTSIYFHIVHVRFENHGIGTAPNPTRPYHA